MDRADTIGASEVAALMGESPWAGPWEVWARIRGMLPPLEQTEAMAWGHRLEPVVLAAIDPEATHTPTSRHFHTVCRLSCQVDGVARDGSLIEVKTTHQDADWRGVPRHYWWQVQAQLECVPDSPYARIGCLIGGQKLVTHTVERDPEAGRRIVAAVDELFRWGDECPHQPTLRAVQRAWPEVTEARVQLPDLSDAIEEYRALRAAEAMAKRGADAAQARLCALLGEHAEGVTPSGQIVSWRQVTRKGYTVAPSTYRRFEVK